MEISVNAFDTERCGALHQRISMSLAPEFCSFNGSVLEKNRTAKIPESACGPASAVGSCLGRVWVVIIPKVAEYWSLK